MFLWLQSPRFRFIGPGIRSGRTRRRVRLSGGDGVCRSCAEYYASDEFAAQCFCGFNRLVFVLSGRALDRVGPAGASGYLAVMAFVAVAPNITRPTSLLLNVFVASIASFQFYRAGH